MGHRHVQPHFTGPSQGFDQSAGASGNSSLGQSEVGQPQLYGECGCKMLQVDVDEVFRVFSVLLYRMVRAAKSHDVRNVHVENKQS